MSPERSDRAPERRRLEGDRAIEEDRTSFGDRDLGVAPRIERCGRRDGRTARLERCQRGRATAGECRDVQARLERRSSSIGAGGRETIIEATTRAHDSGVERDARGDAFGRRGVAVGLGGREQHVDECRDGRVVRDERAFVRCRPAMASHGASHAIVRGV